MLLTFHLSFKGSAPFGVAVSLTSGLVHGAPCKTLHRQQQYARCPYNWILLLLTLPLPIRGVPGSMTFVGRIITSLVLITWTFDLCMLAGLLPRLPAPTVWNCLPGKPKPKPKPSASWPASVLVLGFCSRTHTHTSNGSISSSYSITSYADLHSLIHLSIKFESLVAISLWLPPSFKRIDRNHCRCNIIPRQYCRLHVIILSCICSWHGLLCPSSELRCMFAFSAPWVSCTLASCAVK